MNTFQTALWDLVEATKRYPLWLIMGWNDIKQRYRRSLLGPLWMTLTMGAMILGMGPLYAYIMHARLADYYPHLAIGFIVWGYIANVLAESGTAFSSAEGFIRQTRMPLALFVYRIVWRNFIVLAHYALLIIPVFLYAQRGVSEVALLAIPGLLILLVTSLGAALLLSVFCTRYRDMQPLVATVTQLFFFLTPVLWTVPQLSGRASLIELNPFYYLLEIVRAPLLDQALPLRMYVVSVSISVVALVLGAVFFARYRHRVAYWV